MVERSSPPAPGNSHKPLISIVYIDTASSDVAEISPCSVADTPYTTHQASLPTTSVTKPSVVPGNSALVAYKAQLDKKRTQESFDGAPPESAAKHRAVEVCSVVLQLQQQ